MKDIDVLYDLCEVMSDKLQEATEKIHMAGDELTAGDVEYIDKLTHTLKSIKTIIAMAESESGGSYDDGGYGGGGSYRGGYNRRGGVNRGRGRTARRDSMGRYSRDGENDHTVKELEQLKRRAQDDTVRMAIDEAIEAIKEG